MSEAGAMIRNAFGVGYDDPRARRASRNFRLRNELIAAPTARPLEGVPMSTERRSTTTSGEISGASSNQGDMRSSTRVRRSISDSNEAWGALLAFAASRHGAFSRSHARNLDVSDKMLCGAVRARRVDRVSRSAFRVAGSAPTWEQRLVIACDVLGHNAHASRRSAAALNGFERFERTIVEVTADQHVSTLHRGAIVHRTSLWVPDDLMNVNGIPCTDPIRTFIDLGAVLSERRHEEVLDAAERDDLFTREALERRLTEIRVQGRNGVGYTRRLLENRPARGHNPTNAFERKFLRLIERAGLPRPECQVPIVRADGRIAWIDFCWIDLLFGVESDGHIAHATRAQRRHDAQRDRALLERDFEIVRYTWDEVDTEPDEVVRSLARHLDRRATMVAQRRIVVPDDLKIAMRDRRIA
jgi:very-short-patch-repair endonuclease